MENQNGIHITFRALTGVKVNMNWPTWDGENQVDDPNEPGKKLWIPNFAEGVNDPTNAALLKRIGEIVFQDLKVRYKCIEKRTASPHCAFHRLATPFSARVGLLTRCSR
jgi:hypothetical protein